jgi:hypothetical protein
MSDHRAAEVSHRLRMGLLNWEDSSDEEVDYNTDHGIGAASVNTRTNSQMQSPTRSSRELSIEIDPPSSSMQPNGTIATSAASASNNRATTMKRRPSSIISPSRLNSRGWEDEEWVNDETDGLAILPTPDAYKRPRI